jgi:uncharacterized protein with GYD domain
MDQNPTTPTSPSSESSEGNQPDREMTTEERLDHIGRYVTQMMPNRGIVVIVEDPNDEAKTEIATNIASSVLLVRLLSVAQIGCIDKTVADADAMMERMMANLNPKKNEPTPAGNDAPDQQPSGPIANPEGL